MTDLNDSNKIEAVATKKDGNAVEERETTMHFADVFAALGSESRLGIIRLLLAVHPDGLCAGEIERELDVPAPTLSHHLDRLRRRGLIEVTRERTFLRYRASTEALGDLMAFLYAECCTRTGVVDAREIFKAGPRGT